MVLYWIDKTEITASIPPAAANVWPVYDLVLENGGIFPKRAFMALPSLSSLLGVPVPCTFI